MDRSPDILDLASTLKARDEPFALATVVRTVSVTAAKAGAKAVIRADGEISGGWIGGGCARGAVLKAAREALADGRPRLVSIQPMDLLRDQGLRPGAERDGIAFAKNMCPSRGTMDVFVEPVLPRPRVVVLGGSPVAVALADLARRVGYAVTVAAPTAEHAAFATDHARIEGYDLANLPAGPRYLVVSTQGKGDEAALDAALKTKADAIAFVGSHRKAAALRDLMLERGHSAERLASLRAPAGLDIGAITPDEIALSIVAEITQIHRMGQRGTIVAEAGRPLVDV